MFVSETYSIVDAYKYSSDGSTLDGTFTVSDGYITNCQSTTGITSFGLTGDFEMSFQHYINATSVTSPDYNALWNIGQDNNNGVLIGVEGAEKRIRIYNRSTGSNTSAQIQTNAYNTKTWNTFIIRYVNGVWSLTSGSYTLSYSKSFTPAFIRLNSNFTSTRLKEFMIKPL